MLKWISLGLGLAGLAAASGLLLDGTHADGRTRTSLHGNGSPKESTCFVDGLRHGPTTRWYPDGQVRAEGRFEHGQRVGDWIWYEPDGTVDLERSGAYRGGQRVVEAGGVDRPTRDGV